MKDFKEETDVDLVHLGNQVKGGVEEDLPKSGIQGKS